MRTTVTTSNTPAFLTKPEVLSGVFLTESSSVSWMAPWPSNSLLVCLYYSVRVSAPHHVGSRSSSTLIRKLYSHARTGLWARMSWGFPSVVSRHIHCIYPCVACWTGLRIGAQVLSHYCDLFPQVSSWLLFIVGCFNILVVSCRFTFRCKCYVQDWHWSIQGIFLREGAKEKRLIFSWENASSLYVGHLLQCSFLLVSANILFITEPLKLVWQPLLGIWSLRRNGRSLRPSHPNNQMDSLD